MSRRVPLFVLAASAALIATQASAQPKCTGASCAKERRVAETSGLGDEWQPRRNHLRHQRNGYVVGLSVEPGPVVVANPPFIAAGGYFGYGGAFGYSGSLGRSTYLFAPNAKIITLDRGD